MSFKDNSDSCKKKLKKAQVKWLYAVAEIISSQARALAPVEFGNLRESIDYKVNVINLEAYVGTNTEYAIWVEFGTGEFAESGQGRKGGWIYFDEADGQYHFTWGQEPKPFLKPAYMGNKKELIGLLNKYLSEIGG